MKYTLIRALACANRDSLKRFANTHIHSGLQE